MASISKNTLYLFTGFVNQKILAFVYFVFLARFLGPELVGKYVFAISFVNIFIIFLDLGLNQILIREVAKDKNKANDYLNNTLTLKIILIFFVYLILFLSLHFLNYPIELQKLIYLASVAIFLDAFSGTIYSLLRSFQNFFYEGIGLSLYEFIVLISGLIVLLLKLPFLYIMLPLIFASIFYFVFGLVFLKKNYQISWNLNFNVLFIKNLIRKGFPFFLLTIFGTIFSYIDIILLGKLAADKYIGFYSAAGKIPAGLRIIPITLAAVLYPTASFYFEKDKIELKRITEKIIFYLILFSLPLTVGLFVLADRAINLLYGPKFFEAVKALQILSFSFLFVFFDYLFFTILNASLKEGINIFNRAIAMFSIIILNLIFTPKLKHLGASLAFLLSFCLLAILGGIKSYFLIRFSLRKIFSDFLKIFLVSLIMGIFIYAFKNSLSLILLILIGSLCYFFGLILLRILKKEDLYYFKNLILSLKEWK
jgi:O-antigen/teichoic acid export membrane protein